MAWSRNAQLLTLGGLLGLFGLVWYFKDQLGVIVADSLGKYWPLPPQGLAFADMIRSASITSGVPADLIARELWEESRFRPDAVNRSSGALGIAQFEPATAAELDVDPMDPASAIAGMGRYLAQVKSYINNNIDGGQATWAMTLAGYDYGEGHVVNLVNDYGDDWLNHAPTETQKYVGQILTDLNGLEPLPPGALV